MAGVDLRTLQELGGWKTASMVSRYAHLPPGHLVAAVERLVAVPPKGTGKASHLSAREFREVAETLGQDGSIEVMEHEGVRHYYART